MLTVNDITSRCPVSEKPAYLVFRRSTDKQSGQAFWHVGALLRGAQRAIDNANDPSAYPDAANDAFVVATTFKEAVNLQDADPRFTDAEVAIYRSPYPSLAAE
ncbi:hypothetical protein [Ruegeria sp.]|uniref:hypothetical protein n=1 Tax=Ruegeria sp. TaxID=1879320 RepID=UPI003B5CA15E